MAGSVSHKMRAFSAKTMQGQIIRPILTPPRGAGKFAEMAHVYGFPPKNWPILDGGSQIWLQS